VKLLDGHAFPRHDAAFAHDVVTGLSSNPRTLPCKWLYDRRGAELFEEITGLDEYYLTRAETAILHSCAPQVALAVGAGATIIELGAGSLTKTRILVAALDAPRAYLPIDVSAEFMIESLASLRVAFPTLRVAPIVADFTDQHAMAKARRALPRLGVRLGFFPGSTIGNLDPEAARQLLVSCGELLGQDSWMVVGVDATDDPAVLLPAYDDARGVTAAFDLNLLARINRELGGNFRLAEFRHEARYNATEGRVEMHLICTAARRVELLGRSFGFAAGESIHTENSYKYSDARFEAMAGKAGWVVKNTWLGELGRFRVHLLARPAQFGASDFHGSHNGKG